MDLTPHFRLAEFEVDGSAVPEEAVPMYTVLCHTLLEPIRATMNIPILITSGYRSVLENREDGGVADSQHIATAEYCAADFKWDVPSFSNVNMRPTFDWIRAQPNLVWDQVILEHLEGKGDIIHLSLTRGINRREALEGETENRSGYESWPVVAYV
jgi:hypothetical protein